MACISIPGRPFEHIGEMFNRVVYIDSIYIYIEISLKCKCICTSDYRLSTITLKYPPDNWLFLLLKPD